MTVSYGTVAFDLFGTLVDSDGSAIDGARRLLEAVRRRPWAIVTSCSSGYARELLQSANLPEPDVLIGSDDVERTKPAPDGYRLAAVRLGVPNASMLVVEDSVHGVIAAREAGCDVVAIGSFQRFATIASYTVRELCRLELAEKDDGIALTIPS